MEPDDDRTREYTVLTRGTPVGRYRIEKKIGAGGMGEVYLAEDTELDRKVALKFLPSYLCPDEDCRKRFKREAQAAAKLSHPNIIHIYEVSEYQGRPFFAMEHVEGRTLQDVKKEELDIDRIIGIAIQLCDGLQTAHSAGVTHRDIKPSNIIIDSAGRPRLVDFGLAAVKGGEHLTKTGSTLGTVGYMSPEQIEGKATDARSDLFSLGIVFYELIAGRSPFRREDGTATLKAIIQDTPEPLARYKTGVPDDLQRIVSKLLEKDPSLRYQSAADVIPDLKKLFSAQSPAVKGEKKGDWWNRYVVPLAGVILLAVLAVWYFGFHEKKLTTSTDDNRIMLAVLPFENLGKVEDEYFADGVTDEITTSLARLSGLGVISRTSTIQYKNTEKSIRQIGKELKVDCILEGTIRWDKSGGSSRVRINPQLIRVSDDSHVWANRYDAVLNDIFEVQSTIAREVAAALDIALLQTERDALAERPGIDPAAYDFYLRGKQYFSIAHYRQDELRTAEKMHLKAVELAPEFAPAYAELGEMYVEIHWDGTDTTRKILDSARALIDMALELAPDSPEPYQALGWYYYHGLLDFGSALEAFSRVLQLQPNNSLAIASVAWVYRRQGKWEEAIEGLRQAVQLSPRESWYYYELGNTYNKCRRFEEGIASYNQAIQLDPLNEWPYFAKSWGVLNLTGAPSAALKVVDEGLEFNPRSPVLTYVACYYHLCGGNYDRALHLMTGPGDLYAWQYKNGVDYYYIKARTLEILQRNYEALVYLDSARDVMENMTVNNPDNAVYQGLIGKVYACLNEKEKAIAAAQRAVELQPVSQDALDGTDRIWDLAVVYASLGEIDQAVDRLDTLMQIPSQLSVNWLKIAPEFLSLRDHPRFKALMVKYGNFETQ
ncbi:MAG: protein kinase domain-containing protein [Candidatus Zixiibacteriota bacterium]